MKKALLAVCALLHCIRAEDVISASYDDEYLKSQSKHEVTTHPELEMRRVFATYANISKTGNKVQAQRIAGLQAAVDIHIHNVQSFNATYDIDITTDSVIGLKWRESAVLSGQTFVAEADIDITQTYPTQEGTNSITLILNNDLPCDKDHFNNFYVKPRGDAPGDVTVTIYTVEPKCAFDPGADVRVFWIHEARDSGTYYMSSIQETGMGPIYSAGFESGLVTEFSKPSYQHTKTTYLQYTDEGGAIYCYVCNATFDKHYSGVIGFVMVGENGNFFPYPYNNNKNLKDVTMGCFYSQTCVGPSQQPTFSPVFPSLFPSSSPSASLSISPSAHPTTWHPGTFAPSATPTYSPTSGNPTSSPSESPSTSPSKSPSTSPSSHPTSWHPGTFAPSVSPSYSPSESPSVSPSYSPTSSFPTSSSPSASPTMSPDTVSPTLSPSISPTSLHPGTSAPSITPSYSPSVSPTMSPDTVSPTLSPSSTPTTLHPGTYAPSMTPSTSPTYSPSVSPSACPSASPSASPSNTPTSQHPGTSSPSISPSASPTISPSVSPTISPETVSPTLLPSISPTSLHPGTSAPSMTPSMSPTYSPSTSPSASPSNTPTSQHPWTSSPSISPSASPTISPSVSPTMSPETVSPTSISPTSLHPGTSAPSITPSISPTYSPSASPSASPSNTPTSQHPGTTSPSTSPSTSPTISPSVSPTMSPDTISPSLSPSNTPTSLHPGTSSPTAAPSVSPTLTPTLNPTGSPSTEHPSTIHPYSTGPSQAPSPSPTSSPTVSPSTSPTAHPSTIHPGTSSPSFSPSSHPTNHPLTSHPASASPSASPSTSPSTHPLTSHPASETPTSSPTLSPTMSPTLTPTAHPFTAHPASDAPSLTPTLSPSTHPLTTHPASDAPTATPSISPTDTPITSAPSLSPSISPSMSPATLAPVGPVFINEPKINLRLGTVTLAANASGLEMSTGETATYEWKCQETDSGVPCSNSDVASAIATSLTNRVLVLNTGDLQTSTQYNFTLSASVTTTTIVEDVVFYIPAGPSSGTCVSTPASGTSFDTNFNISCQGWQGSGLHYRYKVDETLLQEDTPISFYNTTLAPNSAGEPSRTVYITITNSAGASTVFTLNVNISSPTLDQQQREDIINSQREQVINAAVSGDVSTVLKALETVNALAQDLDSAALADLQAATDKLLETPPDSAEKAVQQAQVIALTNSASVQGGLLDEDGANASISSISKIIEGLNGDSVEYTDDLGAIVLGTLGSLSNVTANEESGELGTQLEETMEDLGKAMGQSISPGESRSVISMELELSVTKLDVESSDGSLKIGHGLSGSNETVDIDTSVLQALGIEPVAVFSSGVNYHGAVSNATEGTGVVSLTFYDEKGNEIVMSDVEGGIIINLEIENVNVTDEYENVCQFYNETLHAWDTRGCSGSIDGDFFVCNCTHLTTFIGTLKAKPPAVVIITTEDFENVTMANLFKNPFTLFTLLAVFCCYFIVIMISRWCHGEKLLVCFSFPEWETEKERRDKEEAERDFLLQWYFQLPLLAAPTGGNSDPNLKLAAYEMSETSQQYTQSQVLKRNRSRYSLFKSMSRSILGPTQRSRSQTLESQGRDLKSPGTAVTVTSPNSILNSPNVTGKSPRDALRSPEYHSGNLKDLKSLHSTTPGVSSNPKVISPQALLRSRSRTNGRAKMVPRFNMCPCFGMRKETPTEKFLREGRLRRNRIIKRVKKAVRRTAADDMDTLLRESERRERRYLAYAAECVSLQQGVSKARKKQMKTLIKNAARQRRKRRKIWQKSRMSVQARMAAVWWKLVKMSHAWLGVFLHRRLDPYSTFWRANVLLQSLLIVLLVNGLFYQGEEEESNSDAIFVGTVSALVVAIMAYFLAYFAKKVGHIAWEIHLIKIRNELCEFAEDESKEDSSTTAAEVHARRKSKNQTQSNMEHSRDWVLGVALRGFKGSKNEVNLAQRKWKALQYQLCAWGIFLCTAIGSAFIILVLGLKFDLNQDESGKDTGYNVVESNSFKWFISVIVSEAMTEAVLTPSVLLGYTFFLFNGLEVCAAFLIQTLLDENKYAATKAFDVYTCVVRGYRLTPKAFEKLKKIVQEAREKVSKKADKLASLIDNSNDSIFEKVEKTVSVSVGFDAKDTKEKKDMSNEWDEDDDSNSVASNSSDEEDFEIPIPPLHSQYSSIITGEEKVSSIISGGSTVDLFSLISSAESPLLSPTETVSMRGLDILTKNRNKWKPLQQQRKNSAVIKVHKLPAPREKSLSDKEILTISVAESKAEEKACAQIVLREDTVTVSRSADSQKERRSFGSLDFKSRNSTKNKKEEDEKSDDNDSSDGAKQSFTMIN